MHPPHDPYATDLCSCLCTPCAEYAGCAACPDCTAGCAACGYPDGEGAADAD